MKKENHGFIASQIVEEEHYILGDGCLPADVLMPDGHGWSPYLPFSEVQNLNGIETMNCTNYGTLHAIAALGRKKFGTAFQQQLSERYTGVLTGTTAAGNDPHKVAEIIRKECGVVPEVFLPFDQTIDSFEKYYSPRPMSSELLKIGVHWLGKYALGHEWVFSFSDSIETKRVKIKEALKYSPLGISVYAWSRHDDDLYYKDGNDNHWVCLYDFVEGKYWMIFDSYNNSFKKLDWNFNFGQAKRYSLSLNTSGDGSLITSPRTLWQRIRDYLLDIFK